jgi:dTMP kinase
MFVVFEGIDGSGKTTISNRVVRRLKQRGIATCHLREDGRFASSVTEAVRELARDARHLQLVPGAELLLYAARELQLSEEALRPALEQGKLVVADRYFYTAEVLGRFGRGLDAGWVRALVDLTRRGLVPDLVVLVDVDPALARARRKASKLEEPTRKPPSRKGLAGAGLAERLRAGYLELARAEPERFVVIDNEGELDASVARVERLIETALTRGTGVARAEFGEGGVPALEPSRPASVSEALAQLLEWVSRRAQTEPAVAAIMLSGTCGPRVDALRERLAESAPRVVLHGLRGLTDRLSFELRLRLAREYPAAVAASLEAIGNHDSTALALRNELRERAGAEVASSLRGLADDRALELRAELYERHPDAVMASLSGLDSAFAWQLRERYLEARRERLEESFELAGTVMQSVRGSGDARSWELREACWAAAPAATLKSLAGLDDARSWEWRERWLERAPRPVLESLAELRTSRAWALRGAAAPTSKEALDGIAGVDEPAAWALRERYADLWPSTVVKSLGSLHDSARGRTLLGLQLARHGQRVGVLRNAALLALNLASDRADLED